MDLHPYDNVERCFRHTDVTQAEGRAIVARLLRLSALPAGELLYDLSFFSGGIGVLDSLAMSLPADGELWSAVRNTFRGLTPEEAEANEGWAKELVLCH